jgi:hypothetical protein
MAKWAKGKSGNPAGRPRGERTITALLEKRLDKEGFVAKLIGMANGEGKLDPAIQLSAMKLILGYIEGLPIARAEVQGGEGIEIKVLYVNQQDNRVTIAGPASGAGAGGRGGAPLQLLGVRTEVGEDGSRTGQTDSTGVEGPSDSLV